MLTAIQSLYTDSSLAMKINGFHGDMHSPSVGLRQGCPLSATLFGRFIDGLPPSSAFLSSKCRHQDSAHAAHRHGVCWWRLPTGIWPLTSTSTHHSTGRLLSEATHASQHSKDKSYDHWWWHMNHFHMHKPAFGASWKLQVLGPALSSIWSHCSPHHTKAQQSSSILGNCAAKAHTVTM